jgi:hypothetical protein
MVASLAVSISQNGHELRKLVPLCFAQVCFFVLAKDGDHEKTTVMNPSMANYNPMD